MKLDRIRSIAPGVVGLSFSDGIHLVDKVLRVPQTRHPEDIDLCRMEFGLLAKDAAISIALLRLNDDELLKRAEELCPPYFKRLAG